MRREPKQTMCALLMLIVAATTVHAEDRSLPKPDLWQLSPPSIGLPSLHTERATGYQLSLSKDFALVAQHTATTPLTAHLDAELGPRTLAFDRLGFALLSCFGSAASSRGLRVCVGPEITGLFARGGALARDEASLVGNLTAALRLDLTMSLSARWSLIASALMPIAAISSSAGAQHSDHGLLMQTQRSLVQLWLGVRYEF